MKRSLGYLAFTALAIPSLFLTGCNIATPVMYIVHGPPRTEAAFKPADLPTVVFVDDRSNLIPRTALRAEIGDQVASKLMTEKVITKMISSRDAINIARANESEKKLMPMDAIGKAVGADQLIYVEMTSFSLADAKGSPIPSASCQVRVIDVVNRTRLFPAGEQDVTYPLAISLKPVNPDAYRGSSAVRGLEDQIGAELADALAKLFYEHETRETGGNLDPR